MSKDINIQKIIQSDFKQTQITEIQLDPNGFCNAGCWFCPVAYQKNPIHTKKNISPVLLEKILKNLNKEREKNTLISKNISHIYTSHYNEILLYPYLEDFFKLLRKYNFKISIFSNGTPLTPNNSDLLFKYKDVIHNILLNIPVFSSAKLWAKRTNMSSSIFPKLMRNLDYALEKFKDTKVILGIIVNGVNDNMLEENGGWIIKGKNFPTDIPLSSKTGELQYEVAYAKYKYPKISITTHKLVNRAGSISHIMGNKNTPNSSNFLKNKQVVGCLDRSLTKEKLNKGRPFNNLHINSLGKVFLCCNDYDMEIIIGDFQTQSLKEFWGTQNHIEKIEESYKGICSKCISAKYQK